MQKILVGVPWTSAFMHTRWVDAALKMKAPGGYQIEWLRGLGWCPARRFNYLVEKATALDADLIAFLDGDVVVPSEWLEVMAKHIEQGSEVVASPVPMRGRVHEQYEPFELMAWNAVDGKVENAAGSGFAKVGYVSMSAVMMDMKVFRDNPSLMARHKHERNYREPGNTTDSLLMEDLKKCGVDVFVDPSMSVRHIHSFEIDETFSERFADWAVGQE